ncbi:hypothetical protein [Enterococcus sp.]|uniref:hypothetical protein n=1 Tax=Enterococcus sp. TaxID=35783 RepID=UPI002FC63EDC
MLYNKHIKNFLENLEPHHYFNLVEFIIFIIGIYLGTTQKIVYIAISIGYVFFIYIVKTLFEIKYELASDLKFERDKMSRLFIQKNESIILFCPYIKKKGDFYEIFLNISSISKINNPNLRIEYSDSVSCENIITSNFMEQIDEGGTHMSRIEYASFKHHPTEKSCVVNIRPRKKQDDKYFQYEFIIPTKAYNKMSFSLLDSTDKYISDVDFNSQCVD